MSGEEPSKGADIAGKKLFSDNSNDSLPLAAKSSTWLTQPSSTLSSQSASSFSPTASGSSTTPPVQFIVFETPPAMTSQANLLIIITEEDKEKWIKFCKEVKISPPQKINTGWATLTSKADQILLLSEICTKKSNRPYTWESLRNIEKAGMSFIINEGILDCFPQHVNEKKKAQMVAYAVIGRNTNKFPYAESWNYSLFQFVRKGGDAVSKPLPPAGKSFGLTAWNSFMQATGNKKLWRIYHRWGRYPITMFSLHPQLVPLLRPQANGSTVCSVVVMSIIIYYSQMIYKYGQQPSSNEKKSSISTSIPISNPEGNVEVKLAEYTMNASRFMRLHLTAKEKYEAIFTNLGFCIGVFMDRIMSQANPTKKVRSFTYDIPLVDQWNRKAKPGDIYDSVRRQLRYGPLSLRIRLYEGYGNSDTCSLQHPMKYKKANHFVAVIGVALTRNNVNGGLMFLVQDSSQAFPFKNIPLDLVHDMNLSDALLYLKSDAGIALPDTLIFDLDPEHIATAGGIARRSSVMQPSSDAVAKPRPARTDFEIASDPYYLPDWVHPLWDAETEANNEQKTEKLAT